MTPPVPPHQQGFRSAAGGKGPPEQTPTTFPRPAKAPAREAARRQAREAQRNFPRARNARRR